MNRRTFLALSSLAAIGQRVRALLPSLKDKLKLDPLRPQFHLLPASNWMNDPCAPRWFRGQYHMFFQYNPEAAIWGDMHWAHAVSPDLIHWKHLPIALAPTPGGLDSAGCFTGSVLPGTAIPTILYTGVTRCKPEEETLRGGGLREVQCLATSTDPDLRTWSKQEKPVLATPPPGLQVTGFRDPCPWKDGDLWYLIVGSGFNKVGGAVLLYTSPDGHNWTYLHPLAQGQWNEKTASDPVDSGEMWECPDFFPLGDKHVLLYSTERKVYWEVGTFDKRDLRFRAETKGLLDHGAYYAMKSMVDGKGRRLLWGWVEETRSPEATTNAGWAGAMALPRVLTLGADRSLHMDVPPEFDALLRDGAAQKTIKDRSARIECRFHVGASPCSLELRAGTVTLLAIRYQGGHSLGVGDKAVSLSPAADGTSRVQLWLDGSIVETFVDSTEVVTSRCYAPTRQSIDLVWSGTFTSRHVAGVNAISADRLTT